MKNIALGLIVLLLLGSCIGFIVAAPTEKKGPTVAASASSTATVATPNELLVDGGLEIWTNPATLTNWNLLNGTLTRESNPAQVKEGKYSAKITAGASSYSGRIAQSLSSPTSYKNKTLIFGVWVYSAVAGNTIFVSISDSDGETLSTVHSGRGWEYLSATRLLSGTVTSVTVNCYVGYNKTAYFDSAKLTFPEKTRPQRKSFFNSRSHSRTTSFQ